MESLELAIKTTFLMCVRRIFVFCAGGARRAAPALARTKSLAASNLQPFLQPKVAELFVTIAFQVR